MSLLTSDLDVRASTHSHHSSGHAKCPLCVVDDSLRRSAHTRTSASTTFGTVPRFPDDTRKIRKSYTAHEDSLRVRTHASSQQPVKISLRGATGTSSGGIRGSTMGRSSGVVDRDMVRSGRKSYATGEVEAEFIKNLQQQVYYLDLEVNFLRDELAATTSKVEERLSAEYDSRMATVRHEHNGQTGRLRSKIRDLEEQLLDMESELGQAEGARAEAEAQAVATKRELVGRSVNLEREVEDLERRSALTADELRRSRADGAGAAQSLATLERDNRLLRAQLDEQASLVDQLNSELSDSHGQVVQLKADVDSLRQKLSAATATPPEARQWKEDNIDLRSQVKQLRNTLETERQQQQKLSEDLDVLVQENAVLGSQLSDAHRTLESERQQSQQVDAQSRATLEELYDVREQLKHAERNNARLTSEVSTGAERYERSVADATDQQMRINELEAEIRELTHQTTSLKSTRSAEASEISSLRRDKQILHDRVHELESRNSEIDDLRRRNEELSLAYEGIKQGNTHTGAETREKLELYERLNDVRWSDLEQMAGAVKDFTHRLDESKRSTGRVI